MRCEKRVCVFQTIMAVGAVAVEVEIVVEAVAGETLVVVGVAAGVTLAVAGVEVLLEGLETGCALDAATTALLASKPCSGPQSGQQEPVLPAQAALCKVDMFHQLFSISQQSPPTWQNQIGYVVTRSSTPTDLEEQDQS